MKIALDNLFKKPEPPIRYVKIVQKIGTNRWKVVDVYGRIFFVDSTSQWKKDDSISIQSGRILERVPNLSEPNTYEV